MSRAKSFQARSRCRPVAIAIGNQHGKFLFHRRAHVRPVGALPFAEMPASQNPRWKCEQSVGSKVQKCIVAIEWRQDAFPVPSQTARSATGLFIWFKPFIVRAKSFMSQLTGVSSVRDRMAA